ncbi:MAG: hypothetical protein WCE26_09325, partial [Candidatus Acidiferrales bacterium]
MYETRFRPMNRSAYSFLKQNEGDPNNKHCSCRCCKYGQHSQKFLHHVKIHFKPHQNRSSYDSLKSRAELSKLPVRRR